MQPPGYERGRGEARATAATPPSASERGAESGKQEKSHRDLRSPPRRGSGRNLPSQPWSKERQSFLLGETLRAGRPPAATTQGKTRRNESGFTERAVCPAHPESLGIGPGVLATPGPPPGIANAVTVRRELDSVASPVLSLPQKRPTQPGWAQGGNFLSIFRGGVNERQLVRWTRHGARRGNPGLGTCSARDRPGCVPVPESLDLCGCTSKGFAHFFFLWSFALQKSATLLSPSPFNVSYVE